MLSSVLLLTPDLATTDTVFEHYHNSSVSTKLAQLRQGRYTRYRDAGFLKVLFQSCGLV